MRRTVVTVALEDVGEKALWIDPRTLDVRV